MTTPAHPEGIALHPAELGPDDFDALEAILDDLRTRNDETPQWEFCEGFMAALICCRRAIPLSEYFPVLLGIDAPLADGADVAEGSFADLAQAQRFTALWSQRWDEVTRALNAEVESLDAPDAYQPEVMDVRGAIAALPEAERAAMQDQPIPSFGQIWAIGFMFAVESWPEEWAEPRDKDAADILDGALEAIVAMTEDDTEEPTLPVFDENGPPTVSAKRLNAFGEAIWAVYDLRELWRTLGPRVQTVRKAAEPGRNDLCHCGSGKKYKKCHGAN